MNDDGQSTLAGCRRKPVTESLNKQAASESRLSNISGEVRTFLTPVSDEDGPTRGSAFRPGTRPPMHSGFGFMVSFSFFRPYGLGGADCRATHRVWSIRTTHPISTRTVCSNSRIQIALGPCGEPMHAHAP